jgi:hypothetical protein
MLQKHVSTLRYVMCASEVKKKEHTHIKGKYFMPFEPSEPWAFDTDDIY